ncbi:hypothetical protein HMPREF0497_0085 [Lentilactobacillus buchneri ATCC 11577]|uniref:Uncharacterized protein n=1 Tax=Lentilactobacillus hilgardii (strain ATCC 8290 / DSM 20176 / CCUG 30140 / JCM 1155 / KCTC 3500 / NBRC 15886 / NCIMB 8040 / NRRL B-1843 / 9) TaxID=1423757 RepID=C0XI00_LENH9|nr:hypothetical protein HMPREF0497_0085 [Lentilactobacillus buchneri ATCC 11577]EEI25012.1 hypothetical protein HMPREF0519_0861 [Lentilactobacillus hilgardii DSM 20176 = ATCC 8290]
MDALNDGNLDLSVFIAVVFQFAICYDRRPVYNETKFGIGACIT